jgi:hypothetical protein
MTEKAIDGWFRRHRTAILFAGGFATISLAIHLVAAMIALYGTWPFWALVTLTVSLVLSFLGQAARLDDLEEQHRMTGPMRRVRPDDC